MVFPTLSWLWLQLKISCPYQINISWIHSCMLMHAFIKVLSSSLTSSIVFALHYYILAGLCPHLICALPNQYCFQTIVQCTEVIWKNASHTAVGGITTSQVWIGFTMSTLPMSETNLQPSYCCHVIRGLLEFAPQNVEVLHINCALVPDTFSECFYSCSISTIT